MESLCNIHLSAVTHAQDSNMTESFAKKQNLLEVNARLLDENLQMTVQNAVLRYIEQYEYALKNSSRRQIKLNTEGSRL